MTYLHANKKRLAWLVSTGLSPDELKRFFREKRNPLLLAGVKVQIAPASHEDAINRVVHFEGRANAVFATWLASLETEKSENYRGQLVEYIRAIETCGLKLSEKEARRLARAGLQELFSESPNAAWVELLQTEIGNGTAPTQSEPANVVAIPRTLDANDIDAVGSWVLGERTASELPASDFTLPLVLVEAVKSGNLDQVFNRLSIDARESLNQHHARFQALNEKKRGFEALDPAVVPYDPHGAYLSKEVVAVCASGTGPYFLDVAAFLDEGGATILSEADMKKALPEKGRLILHADTRLGAPEPGVAQTYRVERYATSQPIKCRAIRHGRRLVDVVYIPHVSDNRDLVRQWIEETVSTDRTHRVPVVYVLADGVCIKSRQDGRVAVGGSAADWHFDSWNYLQGWQFAGRAYVAEPLPAPDSEYECVPPSVIVRQYLKTLSAVKTAKFTKQQLADLSKYLVDRDVELSEQLRARLVGNLAQLRTADVHYDEIVEELLRSPAVAVDIEKGKQGAFDALASEMASEREALARLVRERQEVEKKIKSLKSDAAKRAKDVENAIKKAFKHAAENELETLGQLAIVRELLVAKEVSAEQGRRESANDSTKVSFVSTSGPSISATLVVAGFPVQQAALIEKAIICAKKSGVPVVINGIGASRLAAKFAAALTVSRAAVMDVQVGDFSCDLVKEVFDSDVDVLAFTSANQSSPSAYARPVIDATLELVLDTGGRPRMLAIFAGISGPTALPWPEELEAVAIRISLDSEPSKDPVDIQVRTPIQQKLWARLERAAEEMHMSTEESQMLGAMFGAGPLRGALLS